MSNSYAGRVLKMFESLNPKPKMSESVQDIFDEFIGWAKNIEKKKQSEKDKEEEISRLYDHLDSAFIKQHRLTQKEYDELNKELSKILK